MKTKLKLGLRIVLGASILALILMAEIGWSLGGREVSFANCHKSKEQIAYYKGFLNPQLRTQGLLRLVEDLERINEELAKKDSKQPKSLLEPCQKNKIAAIHAGLSIGQSALAGSIQFWLVAGRYYLEIKDFNNAELSFARVLEIQPKHHGALWGEYRAWTLKGLKGQKPKDSKAYYKQMTDRLNMLVDHKETSVKSKEKAHWALARVAAYAGTPEKALHHWQKTLGFNPRHIGAMNNVAQAHVNVGNNPAAIAVFEKYLPGMAKNKESFASYMRYIELLRQEKQNDKALSVLQMVKGSFPQDQGIKIMLARELAHEGRFSESEKIIKELESGGGMALDETRAMIAENRGDSYLEKRQKGTALKYFLKALKHQPGRKSARLKSARLLVKHHQADGFKESPALRKDMSKAADLLSPLFQAGTLVDIEIGYFIHAASLSKRPQEGAQACDEYKRRYGEYRSAELTMACSKVYGFAGRPHQSKKLELQAMTLKAQREALDSKKRNSQSALKRLPSSRVMPKLKGQN